jgi:hypothetical protein
MLTRKAVSLSALLVTNRPLFTRVILMSGDVTLRRIRKSGWHNAHYNRNIKMLGLDQVSPQERMVRIYKMTAEEIIRKLPLLQYWSPAIDGSFLTKEVDLGMLCNSKDMTGKPYWCKEIVMGHTMHDVSYPGCNNL